MEPDADDQDEVTTRPINDRAMRGVELPDVEFSSEEDRAIVRLAEAVEQADLLPLSVKVGPHYIDITEAEIEGDLRGLYNAFELTIQFAPGHPVSKLRDTVMHEVMHAVNRMTGFYEEYGHEAEELLVQRQTPYLIALLRENPELVAFFMQGVEW